MKIVSIAVSKKKGTRKVQVDESPVIADHGLEGDAHAGAWHRQVSFLSSESIEKARESGVEDIPGNQCRAGRLCPGRGYTDWEGMPHQMRHILYGWRLYYAQGGHIRTCSDGWHDKVRR